VLRVERRAGIAIAAFAVVTPETLLKAECSLTRAGQGAFGFQRFLLVQLEIGTADAM
jgi:hypothetical protein